MTVRARHIPLWRDMPSPASLLRAIAIVRPDSDTGWTMKQTQPIPTNQGEPSMPAVERRSADRTHDLQWPEAMREELRRVQFLAAVEVDEVDADAWHDILASFEGSHIRFL